MHTPLLIEQHIHGAFGIDFGDCESEDIVFVAQELLKRGIGGFFPTLVTDSVQNIKRQIGIIKKAKKFITEDCAEILGIHLEGIFLNPQKKGIHNPKNFLPLTVGYYKDIEDDFIKIITLAPELDKGLIDYLEDKDIKIQAGHCVSGDLSKCDGVTHLFNAMEGISHRSQSTALSALIDDRIYTEIIADGVHLSDEAVRLALKSKPMNRVLLISDALPITYSDLESTIFAGEVVFKNGKSTAGTIAGSTVLTDKIVKRLGQKDLFSVQYIKNVYNYHGINIDGEIVWDDEYNILSIRKGKYKCVAMQ